MQLFSKYFDFSGFTHELYLIIRTRFLSEILILRIILRHYLGLRYETTFTLFPAQSSGTKSWSSPISQKLFDKICLNKINFLWRLIPLSQVFNGNVTTQKLRCNVAGLHVNDCFCVLNGSLNSVDVLLWCIGTPEQ